MDPFNSPSRPREDEELVSPRGTRFQNYNALLNNSLPLQSNEQVDQGESDGTSPPLYAVNPLHRFTKVRQLVYTGNLLGKRPINSGYNPPWAPKRCRTDSEPRDLPEEPFFGDFLSASDHPNHVPPQNVGDDGFLRMKFAHQVYRTDPYLSKLPLTAKEFNELVRPPGLFDQWAQDFGLGNDWPPSSYDRINPSLVHPLLYQLIGFRSKDPETEETNWSEHREYPELWRALMLATHFLSNTHTIAFFHKILFQEPELLEPESRFYGVPVHHFPTTTPIDTDGLTEAERMKTSEALCALAEHIKIRFGPRSASPPGKALTLRDPRTSFPPEDHTPSSSPQAPPPPARKSLDFQVLAALGFRGTNARITLSSWFLRFLESDSDEDEYGNLKPDYEQPLSLGPPFYERQYALFFLALTLVGEIAHAAWLCRWQRQEGMGMEEHQPFVGGMRRADLGRAWECSVFGGTVEVLASNSLSDGEYLDNDDMSGERFAMGLGLTVWPDNEEESADSRYYEMPVPLARVLDQGDMMDLDVSSGVAAVQAQVAETANGGPGTKAVKLPVVQSADRWESLRVMPFWFVAQFFQEKMWLWAHGPGSTGGEKSAFKQWIETEVRSWPLAVRENPRWGDANGARPADRDAELEAIQRDVDMESDCSDGPGY